jgi:hydrogenase nickel incorporation protein HypB
MKIPVVQQILDANEQVAAENRATFKTARTFVLNLMASPGAGKTSLILATLERLPPAIRPGVVEGDLAGSIDAEAIAVREVPVVQINTGGGCHLDAPMIRAALSELPLERINLLYLSSG